MRYLGMCTLLFISTLNIFGDEDFQKDVNIVFIQFGNYEQQEKMAKMRLEFLENFGEIKNKLALIKTQTQNEMRKESPNWNEIKKLNREYSRLQEILNKGMADYRYRVQNIQIDIAN